MKKAKCRQNVNNSVHINVDTFIGSLNFAHNELKLSYGYLAKILGIGRATIYSWVNGTRKPKPSTVKKCYMILLDLVEANTYKLSELSDFSLNHMGPPENHFSFKASDDPFIKKVLGLLTYYEGVLGIGNKVLLDTAAYYVRSYLAKKKVKRNEAGMFALAALRVAMLKFGVERNISHLIEDQKMFSRFFKCLAIKYLSGLRGREVAETEQAQ